MGEVDKILDILTGEAAININPNFMFEDMLALSILIFIAIVMALVSAKLILITLGV